MAKYVVDAGPLIHLSQINHLKILQKLPSIVIPISVIQEIKHDTAQREIRTIGKWANTQIISPLTQQTSPAIISILRKYPLQKGEIDCIDLAVQMDPCVFLTDDLAARRAAEKLNVEVHGTVGLIAYAVRQKWLSAEQAREALDLLYHRSSLFITYALIEAAIRSLKNSH